jgi:hypothetical protein
LWPVSGGGAASSGIAAPAPAGPAALGPACLHANVNVGSNASNTE